MNKNKKKLQRKLQNGIITTIILVSAILLSSVISYKVVQAEELHHTISEPNNQIDTAENLEETFKVEVETENKEVFHENYSSLPKEIKGINETASIAETRTSIHEYEKEEPIEDTTINEEEVILLAEVMWAEAEEYINLPEEKAEEVFKLVGSVVINRKNDQKYFSDVNTIEEVIYDKGQYAKRTKNMIGKGKYNEKVYEWAKELIKDGPIGPSNLLYEDDKPHGNYIYKKIGKLYFGIKE